jgi:hypothetical protein
MPRKLEALNWRVMLSTQTGPGHGGHGGMMLRPQQLLKLKNLKNLGCVQTARLVNA